MDRVWMIPAVAIALVTIALAAMLKLSTGYPGHPSGIASLEATILIVTFAAIVRFLIHLFRLWRGGEAHPINHLRREFVPAVKSFTPVAGGILILGLLLYSITFLKSMIPAVVPFWADELFGDIDRALLIDPEGIAKQIGPGALATVGLYYGIWHLVHLGGILWVLHWRRADKGRFILSFMLTWSIGMAMAYLFSSAGPLFTGDYDPAVAPDTVRMAAQFLWNNYKAEGALIGGGISAFPSMHVALAAWFALVLTSRKLIAIGLLYFLSIFICSIVLGWHYVADGIGGAAIAIIAHKIAGRWTDREVRRSALSAASPTFGGAGRASLN